jgi:hypothetical protein
MRVWQDGGVKRPSSIIYTARRHRTDQEIAGILKDHRRSGLSLLAFARREGLCYASLLRWRSRPPKGAKAPASCKLEADPGFIPVKIQSEGLGGEYVLSWPAGRSLRIPRQFETDSLRRLLSVLEAVR